MNQHADAGLGLDTPPFPPAIAARSRDEARNSRRWWPDVDSGIAAWKGFKAHQRPGASQRAQRISDHDVLPAQRANRQIVALRQIAAGIVRRQQILGMRSHAEVRFVDVTGGGGGAFQQIIRGERLRATGEPKLPRPPIADVPVIRRTLKGAAVGGDKLRRDGSRKPVEPQEPAMPVGDRSSPSRRIRSRPLWS